MDAYIIDGIGEKLHGIRTECILTIGRWIGNIENNYKLTAIHYVDNKNDEGTVVFACYLTLNVNEVDHTICIVAYASDDIENCGFGVSVVSTNDMNVVIEEDQLLPEQKSILKTIDECFPNLSR